MEKEKDGCKILEEFEAIQEQFSLIDYLGSGAYGIVCAVREKKGIHSPTITLEEETSPDSTLTSTCFAIKKCKNIFQSRTLAKRTLREIRLLRYISHPNIIKLNRAFITEEMEIFQDVYLMFELMDTDLAQVIKSSQKLKVEHIQHFTYQLLHAIKHLHSANIIHRDIK
jgi:serine/threonine protein kinase